MESLNTTQATNHNKVTTRKVPELSLNAYLEGGLTERARFIDQFFVGLKDYGFIVLKDHNVEVSLLKKAYELMGRKFFLS